jgi:hypothetical protein
MTSYFEKSSIQVYGKGKKVPIAYDPETLSQ